MENIESKNSETQAIIDLATSIKPVEIAGQDHIKRIALPPGWQLEEENDENLRDAPHRKTGIIRTEGQESFIEYINRHKITDLTTIYCQADYRKSKIKFDCIINDHRGDKNGQQWRDHIVSYNPIFSEEWERWSGSDKKSYTQLEFAEFIEENLQDIAAIEGMPTGAQLLEMAVSFEANQERLFKSSIRLQSGGIQLSFVDDDTAQTLQQMKLFERISIGIPVFWSGTAYRIDARLRYRAKQGVLTFWYELIRPDKVMEDATMTMINQIRTGTDVPLYFGSI